MNPRSTDYNVDALTTAPSCRFNTDINNSVQLLIFIHCLSSSFKLCEYFLSMKTRTTRTGEDIFTAVNNACIRSRFNLKNLCGIYTDGAPAMTGNQLGFVVKFSDYLPNEYSNKQLINLHCIIHQEAICVKSVTLNSILKDVNCIIQLICSNALHPQQFREILYLLKSSAEDTIYHPTVCWFSQGEISPRGLLLRKEIVEFYSIKTRTVSY